MVTRATTMEPLLDALGQTLPKNICPPDEIVGIMREWKGMGENVLKSLVDYFSDIESREKKLSVVRDSLEKRLKDLDAREREFNSFWERSKRELALGERLFSSVFGKSEAEIELREKELDEQLKLVREHIDRLEVAQSEVHILRLMEHEKLKEVEKREKEIEQREKEFYLFQEEKLREIALKEEILSRKKKDFSEEVRLENKKLSERAELGLGMIERLGSGISMLEGMKAVIDEKFREIKSWEAVAAHKSFIVLNEADSILESMEKQLTERDLMEHEFNVLLEHKLQYLEAREGELGIMRKKLLNEIMSRDEKLTERFKEIESCEVKALKSLTESLKEVNSLGEALDKRFKEFEEMEKEYNSIQEVKMLELASKERQVGRLKTQVLKLVKWGDGKSTKVQNSGHQNLESLEYALSKKLKEIESREESLNLACETLGAREKDAELSRESADIWLQELANREKEFQVYENKKMQELVFAEEKLRLIGKEFIQEVISGEQKFDIQYKMVHGLLEKLELAQNRVKEMNKLVRERFKEIGCKEVELSHTKEWVERKLVELEVRAKEMNEQEKGIEIYKDVVVSEENSIEGKNEAELKKTSMEPECYPTGLELKREQNGSFNKLEFKQPQSSNDVIDACLRGQPGHPNHDAQMDGKTIEMLLNDNGKDLELVGAEIFKVLILSFEPAKLVLDAVEGFYIPCLGRKDIKSHVRRKCILLLDQLTKMSPNIWPSVRQAAIRLASQWKSKMIVAENSLEVLGFLLFLAAYNLSSCFDKDELLSLLRKVAQHKQTPELFPILGLSGNIADFIQTFINKNQYLLASTYIHECGLENMFPQAVVLNYYMQHLKAKHRREHISPDAQDKVISREIADLHVAVKHIIKHGLESEYSPDILTARINQLESDQASLRNRTQSSTYARKPVKGKRFNQTHFFNESRTHEEQKIAANGASPASKSQNPLYNSENKAPLVKRLVSGIPKVKPNSVSKRRKLHRGWIWHGNESSKVPS